MKIINKSGEPIDLIEDGDNRIAMAIDEVKEVSDECAEILMGKKEDGGIKGVEEYKEKVKKDDKKKDKKK